MTRIRYILLAAIAALGLLAAAILLELPGARTADAESAAVEPEVAQAATRRARGALVAQAELRRVIRTPGAGVMAPSESPVRQTLEQVRRQAAADAPRLDRLADAILAARSDRQLHPLLRRFQHATATLSSPLREQRQAQLERLLTSLQ